MKIFDCFTFNNEFDLLKIRLNILWDVVDYFVISEGNFTHSGDSKPYRLIDNINDFTQYLSKLIIVPAQLSLGGLREAEVSFGKEHSFKEKPEWRRETSQRNQLMKGLLGRATINQDVIVISDCDEVPCPKLLVKIKSGEIVAGNTPCFLDMAFFYYKLNLVRKPSGWRKSFFKTFDSKSNFSLIRESSNYSSNFVKSAGWHWSWLGDSDFVKSKLRDFAHQEYIGQKDFVDERLSRNEDVLGRGDIYHPIVVDKTFPEYIINNIQKYLHLIEKP